MAMGFLVVLRRNLIIPTSNSFHVLVRSLGITDGKTRLELDWEDRALTDSQSLVTERAG